jgi:hypothetical protein
MEQSGATPENTCEEMARELRETASWLTAAQLSPEQFCAAVLTLEDAKLRRFGFRLSGEANENGRTSMELRFAEDDRLCASLDYDSCTRQLSLRHPHG